MSSKLTSASRDASLEPSQDRPCDLVAATHQLRVDVCLAIMRREEWVRGVTAVELWQRHGGSLRQWEQAASGASMVRRRELPDEVVRQELDQLLDDLSQDAAKYGQFGPAVAAVRTRMEARGLLKQRHEVTHTVQARPTLEVVRAALGNADFCDALRQCGWAPVAIETIGEER